MSKISPIRTRLLLWYKKHSRQLPWRETKDPYKIWVSEIMLQQTQVDTVIPYYNRWIKELPTVEKLAKANINKPLKLWAGLGYYRRPKMMHQAAKIIHKEFQSQLPNDLKALQALPGIGRYTAGAIASIAFDTPAPIVDGNVIRILTRIFGIKKDIGETKTIKRLWSLAEELVPNKKAGDFNQAMMELGATICLPENPNCSNCPVKRICVAKAQDKADLYPINNNKTKYETMRTAALLIENNDTLLIQQQDKKDRWGGLWMFPHWKDKKTMLKETALSSGQLTKKLTIKHAYTKYRIELEVFELKKESARHPERSRGISVKNLDSSTPSLKSEVVGRNDAKICVPSTKNYKWVSLSKLEKHAFPSPHQKIVKYITGKTK